MWKLKPESLEEEVAQNIAFLLSTPKGTIPMMRGLGIEASFLDDPTPQARAKLKVEVIKQVQKYEERALIESVSIEQGSEGKLEPKVRWNVRDY